MFRKNNTTKEASQDPTIETAKSCRPMIPSAQKGHKKAPTISGHNPGFLTRLFWRLQEGYSSVIILWAPKSRVGSGEGSDMIAHPIPCNSGSFVRFPPYWDPSWSSKRTRTSILAVLAA